MVPAVHHACWFTMQVDNRMRAWYIKNMSVGLLYQCSLGDLRLDSPVALLQNRRQDGVDFMEVVPMEHQLPAQRDQVTSLLPRHAVRAVLGLSRFACNAMLVNLLKSGSWVAASLIMMLCHVCHGPMQ